MRILGIDPGSTATGFGVIEAVAGGLRHVSHGTFRPPRSAALPGRMATLYRALVDLIERQRPDVVAVETIFVAANARSALVLGQARGVALAAAAGASLPVGEYSASQIKRAAVGTGAAPKSQVQAMVRTLLGLDREPPSDAADALAVAICHAHAGRLAALGARTSTRRGRSGRSAGFVVRRAR